jgi:hypothetical protein
MSTEVNFEKTEIKAYELKSGQPFYNPGRQCCGIRTKDDQYVTSTGTLIPVVQFWEDGTSSTNPLHNDEKVRLLPKVKVSFKEI